MSRRIPRRLLGLLGLLLAGGCCSSPLLEELNRPLPSASAPNADATAGRYQLPTTPAAFPGRRSDGTPVPPTPQPAPRSGKGVVAQVTLQAPGEPDPGVRKASVQLKPPEQPQSELEKRLIVPPEIQGSQTPPIDLPPTTQREQRDAAIARYF